MALFNKKRDLTIDKEIAFSSLQANPYIDELVEHYKARLLTETNLDTLTALSEGSAF